MLCPLAGGVINAACRLDTAVVPPVQSKVLTLEKYAAMTSDRYWRGNLRALFDELMNFEGDGVWEKVFRAQWDPLVAARGYFDEIRHRPCSTHAWPDLLEGESENFYCASRLNDVMLLRFQERGAGYEGPDITVDNYVDFFTHLGFSAAAPSRFHPFHCEIVEVAESCGNSIEIIELLWPSLMLGNMMFSRAGVKVSAPAHLLVRGVADQSTLFWSYCRRNRGTTDLSVGWGSNSQWRTDLRRDFDLGDRYAYNVDGANMAIDLRQSSEMQRNVDEEQDAGWPMHGMSLPERIDFLKNRCLTISGFPGDEDLWPYDDYFEEFKEGGDRP